MIAKVPRACSVCDNPLVGDRGEKLPQRKSVLLLVSGSTTTAFSTCLGCEIDPSNLAEVWHRMMILMQLSETTRSRSVIGTIDADVPLGVLWSYEEGA